jgi:hypothetical protein
MYLLYPRILTMTLVLSMTFIYSSLSSTNHIVLAKAEVVNQSISSFGTPQTNSSLLSALIAQQQQNQNTILNLQLSQIENAELQKNLKLNTLEQIYKMRSEQLNNNFQSTQGVGSNWYCILGGKSDCNITSSANSSNQLTNNSRNLTKG